MPLVDLPIEELKSYKGISPKPKDFDEFWDRSLQAAKTSNWDVSLEKSDFQTDFCQCYDLYFTSLDGARIHAKYLVPTTIKGQVPALVKFHGYTMSCGDWTEHLAYVANGYVVAAMDVRGQGGQSEDIGGTTGTTLNGHIVKGLDDEPEKLFFRNVFLDTAIMTWIVMAMEEVDKDRVATFGNSQGGALSLVCASLVPEVSKCVTVHPFLSDYKRVWEMDLAERAYEGLRNYFRKFDPRHEREEAIFYQLGYIDVQNFVSRIEGDVYMATGLMDTVCPPSTQFASYNQMTCQKEMVVYPDYSHEHMPGLSDLVFTWLSKL